MKKKVMFTIIELLIVILIIAILAGMLLPALNKARETARSSNCTSNLKQLVIAIMTYAGNHNDLLPYSYQKSGSEELFWQEVLTDQSYTPHYLKSKVYKCPTQSSTNNTFSRVNSHYGVNRALMPDAAAAIPLKLGSAKTQKLLIADTWVAAAKENPDTTRGYFLFRREAVYDGSVGSVGVPANRHRMRTNFAWLDGHVSTENFSPYIPKANPLFYTNYWLTTGIWEK